MTKVVINTCFGGFGLSQKAIDLYKTLTNKQEEVYDWEIPRDCRHLVHTVETLQEVSSARYAQLKVVEIPDHISWYISDYDGVETIHEHHRTWS